MRTKTVMNIIKSIWDYALGRKVNRVHLSFGTVGWEDIRIAMKYLIYPNLESGPQVVKDYEIAFSTFNGSKYAFSFLQGRVALSACLDALELKKGDKILVPAYTCVGVANACWMYQLNVEFCDIELDTFGMSFDDFQSVMARSTDVKAVIVQHLFGIISRDFYQIIEYCQKNKIHVIEDCAHAAGASFKGVKVGNFGDVAFFSSEQSKVLNTLIGGIAITNNEKMATRIALFQQRCFSPSTKEHRAILAHFIHGYFKLIHRYRAALGPVFGVLLRSIKKGKIFEGEQISTTPSPGYFKTLPFSLAAIGINQLKKLPSYSKIRRLEARKWEEWCKMRGLKLPVVIPSSEPVFLRYPILVDEKEKLDRTWANSLQLDIGVWFVSYLHPIEYEIVGCPNARKAIQSCINFPTLTF